MKYRAIAMNVLSGVMNSSIVTAIAFGSITYANAQQQESKILNEINQQQHICLALNIYYEARSSSLADQVATADVVLNRVIDSRYPDTICKVVKQSVNDSDGNPIRNKCQFSWWCDGKADRPQNIDGWVNAQMLAYYIIEEGKFRGITEGATHYHAAYVSPGWAKDFHLVGRVGAHIFYRWD